MPVFEITMGGYDIGQVDELVAVVEKYRDRPIEERRNALKALNARNAEKFRRRLRGYSKIQVINYINDRLHEISKQN